MDNIEQKFECCEDETKGLRYNGLSIVLFDTFTFLDVCEDHGVEDCCVLRKIDANEYITKKTQTIDSQIFVYGNNKSPIRKYEVEGFTFELKLQKPKESEEVKASEEIEEPIIVSGKVVVEMSFFYNRTVSMSYRIVLNDEDKEFAASSKMLTTDHLISLISLYIDAENWKPKKKKGNDDIDYGSISLELGDKDWDINDLLLNSNGQWDRDKKANKKSLIQDCEETKKLIPNHNHFKEVLRRYKKYVMGLRDSLACYKSYNNKNSTINETVDNTSSSKHAYIDIWESIRHYDDEGNSKKPGLFEEIIEHGEEKDIISHIKDYHKRELIGLMTLYPFEWPHRDEDAFDDICGRNIAIDSDDLVLTNEKITVVFGTYGLRGEESSTDWKNHLKVRKSFHVSWPEHLLILEMLLVKKHTLEYANDRLVESVISKKAFENPVKTIEDNANLCIDIVKVLTQLDAIKYLKFVSHSTMFNRTKERLEIVQIREKLEDEMDRIGSSLDTIKDMQELHQGKMLRKFLGILTFVSFIGLVFADTRIHFLEFLGVNIETSSIIAEILIGFVVLTLIVAPIALLGYFIHNRLKKTERERTRSRIRKRGR